MLRTLRSGAKDPTAVVANDRHHLGKAHVYTAEDVVQLREERERLDREEVAKAKMRQEKVAAKVVSSGEGSKSSKHVEKMIIWAKKIPVIVLSDWEDKEGDMYRKSAQPWARVCPMAEWPIWSSHSVYRETTGVERTISLLDFLTAPATMSNRLWTRTAQRMSQSMTFTPIHFYGYLTGILSVLNFPPGRECYTQFTYPSALPVYVLSSTRDLLCWDCYQSPSLRPQQSPITKFLTHLFSTSLNF